MVWVRRVRTASGATVVQIAESVAGRRRIVRHVGSARDETELGLLIEQAHRLLADDAQGELDLGVTAKTVRAQMVPPPGGALFGTVTLSDLTKILGHPASQTRRSAVAYEAYVV